MSRILSKNMGPNSLNLLHTYEQMIQLDERMQDFFVCVIHQII